MNKLKTAVLMLTAFVSAVPFLTGCQSDTVGFFSKRVIC